MSRGPASGQDFAKWSGLTITDARRGLEAVASQLQQEVVNGQAYWFPAAAPAAKDSFPTACLLSIYDEYISGYKDHSAMSEPEVSARLRAMGNALNSIIVVDGQVVGVWKRKLRKDAVLIETHLYKHLTRTEHSAVTEAARRYGVFLGLPVVLPQEH